MRTLQNDQFLYLSSEDSPCNPSTARFDLVMIENSVKSLNSVTQPLHSTLIIDTDNYMINFLCKHLINPLVLHTSPTFRDTK